MADKTTNESITEALPAALGKYIKENVDGIREYYDEFPNASVSFKLPSVSVVTTSTEFAPAMVPYKKDPILEPNIVDNRTKVLYVVGDYEIKLQVDLWAGSKEERDDLYDATFNALNPKISPMGLTLKLDEYYGILCDYLYIGHQFDDSGEQVQKDEWRATLQVIVTCKAIREKREFVITDPATATEIELQGEISETVVVTNA